jgi:predicted ATPase
MIFTVIDTWYSVPSTANNKVFLVKDRWDDWAKYQTQFQVVVFDKEGNRYEPGSVKIGHVGLLPSQTVESGKRVPALEKDFETLSEGYFSLGQGENYYETLNTIPEDLRLALLNDLKDCAWDLDLFDAVKDEEVMRESLLRDVWEESVRNRLHRLSLGDARLTEFQFEYMFPGDEGDGQQPVLQFHVKPESQPPTNIHILTGPNGVGKTRCLQFMAKSLLCKPNPIDPAGEFHFLGSNIDECSFTGLIFVSFSAFDDFELPKSEHSGIRSYMVSLRVKEQDDQDGVSPEEAEESTIVPAENAAVRFRKSFQKCRQGLRSERWQAAIRTLETDSLFAEEAITDLLREPEWQSKAESLFSGLSSGHAIVLLTITRLVELVDERTLVLIDEPESHLHPPFLSAFIRSLSDLLVKRNGVAIIASHSPVVLQEVPKTCVWMLRRSGTSSVTERPPIETFGENVGILTREVYGLEVINSGFHKLLQDTVYKEGLSYERLLRHFGGQLGAEARAIAKGMIAERDDLSGNEQ